jgi:prophage antirepressor|nr:MAG TPA: KilAC domain protein [Caudoviricetes sp.]DAS70662.1 MAG TPA: KilAC domain protein [Caudoviricetes sp.]
MDSIITIQKMASKKTVSSLELVDQINIFRKEEGKETELQHKTMLAIIRDEFEEEIGQQKILPTSYKDQWNREQPMFELTIAQGKQVLLRESKFVRKRVVEWLESLEQASKPMTAGELLMTQAQGMIALEKAQQAQAEQIALQNERLTKIEAKITTKNEDYFTISGYSNIVGRRVPLQQAISMGKKAAKICVQRDIPMGNEYDAKYGFVKSYPTEVLKEVFANN